MVEAEKTKASRLTRLKLALGGFDDEGYDKNGFHRNGFKRCPPESTRPPIPEPVRYSGEYVTVPKSEYERLRRLDTKAKK